MLIVEVIEGNEIREIAFTTFDSDKHTSSWSLLKITKEKQN